MYLYVTLKGGENVRIEIGLWDLCGKKHELTLDVEEIVDYDICRNLLKELFYDDIIGDYGVALVKKGKEGK